MKVKKVTYGTREFYPNFIQSLQETGFAVIEKAPIDPTLVDEVYAQWTNFFNSEDKAKYAPTGGSQAGYFAVGSENAKDQKIKDNKEFYHVYRINNLPDMVSVDTTDYLFSDLETFGLELLAIIDTIINGIGAEKRLVNMAAFSSNTLMRVLHYPPNPDNTIRSSAHEDINLLTILPFGTAPGLQIKDAKGKWHNVEGEKGDLVVNVGDMLSAVLDGKLKSTTHRVVTPKEHKDASRHSIALFLHARPDTKIQGDKTAQQFLDERLKEIGIKE